MVNSTIAQCRYSTLANYHYYLPLVALDDTPNVCTGQDLIDSRHLRLPSYNIILRQMPALSRLLQMALWPHNNRPCHIVVPFVNAPSRSLPSIRTHTTLTVSRHLCQCQHRPPPRKQLQAPTHQRHLLVSQRTNNVPQGPRSLAGSPFLVADLEKTVPAARIHLSHSASPACWTHRSPPSTSLSSKTISLTCAFWKV